MKVFTLTNLLIVVCCAYLFHATYSIYHIWYPDSCLKKGREKHCLKSIIFKQENLKWNINVYSSLKKKFSTYTSTLIDSWKDADFNKVFAKKYNCTVPLETINNGSLYFHVEIFPDGKFGKQLSVHGHSTITEYKVPVSYFQLMNDKSGINHNKSIKARLPTTHWKKKVKFFVLNENFMFDRQNIPSELFPFLKVTSGREYLPVLIVDELSFKKSDLVPLPENASQMEIILEYSPITIGKLRLWITLSHSLSMMKSLGFTDDDLDDVKGIFTDTNLFFLGLTIFVSTVHILFDFLGFKNDISYWNKRKTMLGLSFHTVIYRCISTIIIFLYLCDQKTSLLVLVPAGIGSIIEIWKVTKALKISIKLSYWNISVSIGKSTDVEKTTESFDQQAITYLSYVMYPLCVFGAIYSLYYIPHKSWYSWIIQSLVNGVYAFGFLFMLPQLFINYKLKSVAHLPWKVFMYKAFNTFIDDIFAFIIQMPTSHRLACFRDDVVFFFYLYQLWLYPVDKSRVNEYGLSYEDDKEKKD